MASVPKSEVPSKPEEQEPVNISSGKHPYVYGLDPTNIQAITDGKIDDNYAVHNSLGRNWLQFEYKNIYKISLIKFKLEPGNGEQGIIMMKAKMSMFNQLQSTMNLFGAMNSMEIK